MDNLVAATRGLEPVIHNQAKIEVEIKTTEEKVDFLASRIDANLKEIIRNGSMAERDGSPPRSDGGLS
jgi:hypothetical protein